MKRREVRQRELAAVMSAPRAAVTSAEVKPNRHQNVTVARQEAAEEELSAAIAP